VWNSLPAEQRTLDVSLDTFRNKLKTILFKCICCIVQSWCSRNSPVIIILIIIVQKLIKNVTSLSLKMKAMATVSFGH